MDYPKSVPSVGLVGGKFVDEDTATGVQGSLIPSAWGNGVTDELLNVIKAAGLVPDEENNTQLLDAIKAVANGRLVRQTIYAIVDGVQKVSVDGAPFTAVGALSFTPHPLALSFTDLEGPGGGGSGGGCGATGASQASDSVGGAAGGYVRRRVIGRLTSHPVTVGRGGAAPAPGPNNGNNGGTTSFGSYCSATGGSGGLGFSATSSFPAYAAPIASMPPGTGVNGDVNGVGGIPTVALLGSPSIGQIVSSAGGASFYGSGGVNAVNTIGAPGVAPGSGGSGVASAANSGANSGGKGADGFAIYREYA
ncbi:hypothetical protein [Pseudomonas syringae group sp. J309-1]|uniref:glycine-rich domain-containing protein n=1 Tax=Pseudomonas syringae group sp. J309-1 TaxID=3079588 RepID=UPI00290B1F65|nr:hypothetical protein [Pseudomonas syringae group sp. J309-1]MDU8357970.1 hypothetical protein [Pseudomonas syringae group sp. J309-1]